VSGDHLGTGQMGLAGDLLQVQGAHQGNEQLRGQTSTLFVFIFFFPDRTPPVG
jgi:hypothetical protein